jgi:hypothetical protein
LRLLPEIELRPIFVEQPGRPTRRLALADDIDAARFPASQAVAWRGAKSS